MLGPECGQSGALAAAPELADRVGGAVEAGVEAIPSGRGEGEGEHVEAGALAHPAVADQSEPVARPDGEALDIEEEAAIAALAQSLDASEVHQQVCPR
jgi:hypothetical protein